MAEKVDCERQSVESESSILSWLENEFNSHSILHAKQFAHYLILLLKNHFILMNKVSLEQYKEHRCQVRKPRRFLLSRQRSRSFNSPDDAVIKNMQCDQLSSVSATATPTASSYPVEAVQFMHYLGCSDANYITSLLNELMKRLSVLKYPSDENIYPYPVLPGNNLGIAFTSPHLLKPAAFSEKDLYYSAFPALVPGLPHQLPVFRYPYFLYNTANNLASAWLCGQPVVSNRKKRFSEDVDEGFAEDVSLSQLVQDLRVKESDVVDTLNIEVNKTNLSRKDEQWKPLIKTTRKRNAQSCSFPHKSQCYIYDLQYDEDRVLNSGSLDVLYVDSNKKEEDEMLKLIMKTVDQMKDEAAETLEDDAVSANLLDNFKASTSSSCCDLRWVHTHGAGVPAIIPFSEQTQSASQSILYQPQQDYSQDDISRCNLDLLSDPNKALSRIWERQLYRRRLSGSIGLDGRVIRNSRKGRTVSCSEPLEESSISLLTRLKESCDDSCLPPLPACALQATELERLWAKQSPIDKSKRACSFLLRGRCRKEDCQFAHNLRHVTCRFWQAGDCFKGDDCPFLHGHTFLPVRTKRLTK